MVYLLMREGNHGEHLKPLPYLPYNLISISINTWKRKRRQSHIIHQIIGISGKHWRAPLSWLNVSGLFAGKIVKGLGKQVGGLGTLFSSLPFGTCCVRCADPPACVSHLGWDGNRPRVKRKTIWILPWPVWHRLVSNWVPGAAEQAWSISKRPLLMCSPIRVLF